MKKNLIQQQSLENLDTQLALEIFTFLPAETVFLDLARVSKQFEKFVLAFNMAADIESQLYNQHKMSTNGVDEEKTRYSDNVKTMSRRLDTRCNGLLYFLFFAQCSYFVIPASLKSEYHDYFDKSIKILIGGAVGMTTYLIGKNFISHWGRNLKIYSKNQKISKSIRFLTNFSKKSKILEEKESRINKKLI